MHQLHTNIEVVKTQMLDNIDALIERGGNIENLTESTGRLLDEAQTFERQATTLRRKMLMRNVKIAIAIFLAICVLALIISWVACGITYKKCKSEDVPATWGPIPIPTITPMPIPGTSAPVPTASP